MVLAVILAAGEGTRLRPLTLTKPKPLLKTQGKSILEYNLEALNNLVKKVIIIIGYKGEVIRKEIGKRYKNLEIKYFYQDKIVGTGDAALRTKDYLRDKFLLLNGDDFYDKKDLKKVLKIFPSILLSKVKNPNSYGQVIVEKNTIKKLVEKPEKILSYMVNTGAYFLDKSIFNFKIKKSERGEYEFTDYLKEFIKKEKLYFALAENWIPISYPWNLLDFNEYLFKKIRKKILGKIEKYVIIKGKVFIDKGAMIKSGTYIEGPSWIGKNCQIGPSSYLRNFSSIGDNCHLGKGTEIKNSIIGENTYISHASYLGDSIVGNNCNLAFGTIVANLRHDEGNVRSMIRGELKDTGRKKFGTVIGDNVKTGIGTLIYPGRKIWSYQTTLPGEIVKKDIM